MNSIDSVFYIVILIMSVVVHEVSHGLAAYYLGDMTAKNQGRLTLNPLKHLEWFGSVILPLLLIITNAGFVIGWARPVPYNPRNLSNQKWGPAIVACAGVLANFFLVASFALIFHYVGFAGIQDLAFNKIILEIIFINLLLGIFNLIPIPPLDGGHILLSLLPYRFYKFKEIVETYSIFIFLGFAIVIWPYFSPVVFFLFKLITGIL